MRISLLIAGLLLAASFNALAERTAPRPATVSDAGGPARVIVQFKEGAAVLRAHALSAADSAPTRQGALMGRAQALGVRHGMALRSGAALSEREQVLHGPAGLSSAALAERLATDPDVAWAVPDRRLRRSAQPSDALFLTGGAQGPTSGQWYLRTPTAAEPASIDAQRAWDTTQGSSSVVVAVLDTGIRPHPDLNGKLVPGYDFVSNESGEPPISNDGTGPDSDPSDPGDWLTQSEINADPTFWGDCPASDSSWHGTQVAGIIGAATNNGSGMAGTGWNVRVMPMRVLGKCFGYTSDIQAAMRWAAGLSVPGVPANPNPAQVINLSLGGTATCGSDWTSAINAVIGQGVVVVAAAGNSAGRAATAPANCQGVIGVAAVRHVGTKVGFSDIGPQLAIAAPGGNCVNEVGACLYPIVTTLDTGVQTPVGPTYSDGFNNISVGTSFSSPLVAGTVALMLSARPGLTPAQVKSALQSSARAFPSSGQPGVQACQAPGNVDQLECYCTKATCGAGLLDANAAVAAALATTGGGGNNDSGGGGGGGAMSGAWLLGLVAAVAWLMRRPRAGLAAAALLAGAAAAAAPPARTHGAAAESVHGLIVQLRDAPTHAALAREHALAASADADGHLKGREHGRWRDVVAAMPAHSAGRVTERRAVGESAQLMRFERPMTAAQAQAVAAQLAQRPDVAWVVPNTRERRLQASGPANAPSDPLFGQQWWLQAAGSGNNGAPNTLRAWTQITTGSADSLVAVLDNGIVDHPDLAGKIVRGVDMVEDTAFSNDGDGRDTDPSDPGDWVDSRDLALPAYAGCESGSSSRHGTAIAGIVAAQANNGQGGASMNWPSRVLAVRVAAKCGADVADIIDGMRWVAGFDDVCRRSDAAGACQEFFAPNPNAARVINISFGGTGSCDAYQPTIDALRGRGVVVVAAAGNEHAATPTRPAKCPGVIGVAALNRDGFKSTYSNFGSTLAIATVGGDDPDGAWGSRVADAGVLSIGNDGVTSPGTSSYVNYFGTSFSTPIVAGAVSLMLAVNPALTVAQIEQGLRASARPHVQSTVAGVAACSNANPGRCLCTTATCGAGILDVEQALRYAGNPQGYVAPNVGAAAIDTTALREAAAAGPDRPANPIAPPSGGSDSGGGSMSGLWLLALGTAVVALRRRARGR